MKRFLFMVVLTASVQAANSQALFTYGNNAVSAEEFMRAYNKNKVPAPNKEAALREYLELYANFKLKVKAANDLRLDTLAHIRSDIRNFRTQVQDNYLTDEQSINALYHEAFQRSRKDIHVLHFSVPVITATPPADTLKAFQAIQQLYSSVPGTNSGYQELIDQKIGYPVKFNDLGFITVFTLPYQYENIIYNLKPGQVSKPYRSKNAWHVFKSVEERPAAGKWKVAQVLFSLPPSADEQARASAMRHADSVYQLLKAGADFSSIAQKYSDDKLTYQNGGELPEFGTGKYDLSFEKEVFSLPNDGDITKPFFTQYGIHIVKRLGHTALAADKEDASTQFELKQKIQKDNRIEEPRNRFAQSIMQKIGMKRLANVKESELMKYADSVVMESDKADDFPISNKPILQFKNKTVTAGNWLNFVSNYKGNPQMYKGESNRELWDKYLVFAAVEYYKDNLEQYNPDFRYQMKEFEEGNMLFEVMEKNVWGKAAEDSVALMNHYAANKSTYKWGPSADVLIFNCADYTSADQTYKALSNGVGWRLIAETYESSVQVDSGRYELVQIIGTDYVKTPVANSFSPIVKNSDGTAAFVKYIMLYPGNEQRTFEEAKGLVINDYQAVLEEQWLKSLRARYPVKINEAVFKNLAK